MPQNQQEVLSVIFRCALTRPGRKRRKEDFVACGTPRGVNKGCALLRTSLGPTSASPTPASHLQHYIARLFNPEHTHPKEEPPPGLDFHSLRQKQSIPSKHAWGHVLYSKHPSRSLALSSREHSCHSAALRTKQSWDAATARDLSTLSQGWEVQKS